MKREELTKALCHLKVETGSLACLGCGYEHNCSTHGCAILSQTIADRANDQRCMEALRKQVVDLTQAVALCATENIALKADLKNCLADNCQFCAHHDDAKGLDCDLECLDCEDPRCTCRTCRDGSAFEWRGPRKGA